MFIKGWGKAKDHKTVLQLADEYEWEAEIRDGAWTLKRHQSYRLFGREAIRQENN